MRLGRNCVVGRFFMALILVIAFVSTTRSLSAQDRGASQLMPPPLPAIDMDDSKKKPFNSGDEMRQWIERISGIRFSQTNQRDHETVKTAFREAVSDARRYTVRVFADDDQVALGTIIDTKGYVLTKSSELRGKLVCKLWDGRRQAAEIVGVNREHDIAVLKIDADQLPVVKWRQDQAPAVGSWLATVGQETVPEAIGVVSAAPRKVVAPKGMLGVILEEDQAGARISQVMPGSGAERAKMQLNDIVTHINGKPVSNRQMLVEAIQKYLPGEAIELRLRRDGASIVMKPVLGDRNAGPQAERSEFQNALGGKLSERRSGFPVALQHDTVLRPNLCGGPVVDLDGHAVGINIARAGRVASYALPGSVLLPLLDELKSGKLAPEMKTILVDTQSAGAQKTDSE